MPRWGEDRLRVWAPLVAALFVTAWLAPTTSRPAVARGAAVPPPAGAAFSYQIGGAFPPAPAVRIVDRDRRSAPARGRYGICYVNAFQAQPDELGWWRRRHGDLLLAGARGPVIDPAWNEQLLDTRTAARRRALTTVVGGWIDGCARAGYRAVELDNLDSYTRSDGLLTAAEDVALARLLVARAHRDGLAAGQKNAVELTGEGRRLGFDFAVAEECQAYRECDGYTAAYGREVIEIEYTDRGGSAGFAAACAARGPRISIVLRDRDVRPAGTAGSVERRCPPGGR